ncbi:hypothetical protein GCM10009592_28560 [Brachybacterium rhamnosum]|uniref:Uncharacterized protein n=1 Tax=Brachybacterium rhamnosum TaxID=173361 RepID=A0ABW4Q0W5_9MICO
MDEKQIKAAIGHKVRIESGVENATGVLEGARAEMMSTPTWGGQTLTRPSGDWTLRIDGHTRSWSGLSELEIID